MLNLLYVDDDDALLEAGKFFLEQEGQVTVETITSAPAALELLKERQFDAIIADYMIPKMNGIGFLKQVRAEGYTLPFILFTGRGREEVVIQALNEGADFYLQKGGEPKSLFAELAHKVRQAVEKRRAETALVESMKRLNLAQRLARLGDVTWDLTTGEITLSEGAYDLLQFDRSEKLDVRRVTEEIYYPDDLERVTGWLEECIASGSDTITPNEYRIIRKDGTVLTVYTTGLIQRIDGKPTKVFITLQDITERKDAENMLAILSQSLTDALIMAKMAAWEYDTTTETFTLNDAFYAMHAMTAREAGGNLMPAATFREYYASPAYADRLFSAFQDALDSPDPDFTPTIEGELRKMDGSAFYVTTWLRMERDDAGKTIGFHGVNQDITERKRSEEARENINRQLNMLISVTRHDIRNQLLSLQVFLGLSRNTLSDPEKTLGYISQEEHVVGSIERQISFTKEYQALGVKPPAWQQAGSVIRAVAQGLDLKGVALEMNALENIEVMADPLLTKVFYNLFDNALRHGGGALSKISISSREEPDNLVIVVADNGIGVPPDEKDAIFARGYGRNSGYGLFFVREILSITGITIRENGEQNKGAQFEIRVPKPAYRFCA